jgi:hypothetical protein
MIVQCNTAEHLFNCSIFKQERDEYAAEGIHNSVGEIVYVDNQACIELIEASKPVNGILGTLNEEGRLPRGSDRNFVDKLSTKFNGHAHFSAVRTAPELFVVHHYAGSVTYNSAGFLLKNGDKMHDGLRELLTSTSDEIGKCIFKQLRHELPALQTPYTTPMGSQKTRARTLGGQFAKQLQNLTLAMDKCTPHYIRCIKPNGNKTARTFDSAMVLRQLKYAGLFEAIRVRGEGFPIRRSLREFVRRYAICVPAAKRVALHTLASEKESADFVVQHIAATRDDVAAFDDGIAIGHTKAFMKDSIRIELEMCRSQALTRVVTMLQALARGTRARISYRLKRNALAELTQATADQQRKALCALLETAAHLDIGHASAVRSAAVMLDALNEHERVVTLLSNACNTSPETAMQSLLSAFDQCDTFMATFVNVKVSAEFSEYLDVCTGKLDKLSERVEVANALCDAVVNESIDDLERVIALAKKLTPPIDATAAETLLCKLQAEAALVTELRAVCKSKDRNAIETALVHAGNSGVAIDVSEVSKAHSVLRELYTPLVAAIVVAHPYNFEELQEVRDKMVFLNFPDLLERIDAHVITCTKLATIVEEDTKTKEIAPPPSVLPPPCTPPLLQPPPSLDVSFERSSAPASNLPSQLELLTAPLTTNRRGTKVDEMRYHDPGSIPPAPPLPSPPPLQSDKDNDDRPSPQMLNRPLTLSVLIPQSPREQMLPTPRAFTPAAKMFQAQTPMSIDVAKAVDDVVAALQSAVETRDIRLLEACLDKAQSMHVDSTKPARVARNLLVQLKAQQQAVEQLESAVDVTMKDCRLDRSLLATRLKDATIVGVSHENSVVQAARHLCFGVSDIELLAMQLSAAVSAADKTLVQQLLAPARAANLPIDLLLRAERILDLRAKNADAAVSPRRLTLTHIRASSNPYTTKYCRLLSLKGRWPLITFKRLRAESNYLKGCVFHKGMLKKVRLQWQREAMPRSLVHLSTAYCGGNRTASKLMKTQALNIFHDIRGFCGDIFHAYPVTLGVAILEKGRAEPLLRDEIFCQLIKQSTLNGSYESVLKCWKMMYTCLRNFRPSAELRQFVLGHIANQALTTIAEQAPSLDSVAEVATNCWIVMQTEVPKKRLKRKATLFDEIKSIINGGCTPVLAKLWRVV